MNKTTSVLFTGYAPVHFVCFQPLWEKFLVDPMIEVFVAGGLRTKTEGGYEYDSHAMFDRFKLPPENILSIGEITERDFDYLFAANTKMIMPRNAGSRVQIFHGISFRNKAVRAENTNASQYFIVGPYMQRAFQKANLISKDDSRAIPTGFMKTDRLLNDTFNRDETLAAHRFSGDRPVLLYAPTGQKHNSLETMGEELIQRIAKSNAFDLIVKPHDHPKNPINWIERLSSIRSKHVTVSHESDVTRLLHAADLLITDASSVSSEYSLLNRPMIFLDVPKLIKKAKSADNTMVDLNTWGRRCGEIVAHPKYILQTIDYSLEHPDARSVIRKEMAADLFFNPGHATDYAFEWFKNHANIAIHP